MREADWQALSKPEIIRLILDHNAGIEPLRGALRKSVKVHLETMNAVQLFRHVADNYNGVLYEPDEPGEPLPRTMWIAPEHKSLPKTISITRAVVYPAIDEADIALSGKDWVMSVEDIGGVLLVTVAKQKLVTRVDIFMKLYPTVQYKVVVK